MLFVALLSVAYKTDSSLTGTEANGKHVENIFVSIVSFCCAWFSERLLGAGYFKTGSYTRIRAAMNTVENTSFDRLEKHSTGSTNRST